jgi:hypothetical protein
VLVVRSGAPRRTRSEIEIRGARGRCSVLGSRERAGTGRPVCWVRERELGRDGRSAGFARESWDSRSVLGSRVRAGTAGMDNIGDPTAVCGRAGSRFGHRSVGR